MKKLNARLQAIADSVCGEIIADIGSDHAYLPAWLVKNDRIKKAYAVDISVKCVERIKTNLARFRISNEIIEPVLADGLASLELSELSDVIIAGMGGENIVGILSAVKIKDVQNINFILQPNTKQDTLHDYLIGNGFEISQELVIQEKRRFYTIFVAKIGGIYV